MKDTFTITTHIASDKIVGWMLEHGYASKIDAEVDVIMALLDGQPFIVDYDGQRYSVGFDPQRVTYDVSMTPVEV
jgi:hypothetical protein